MGNSKVKAKKIKCETDKCTEKGVEKIVPAGLLYHDDEPVLCGVCGAQLPTVDFV